jgi:hypothetical protein
VSLILLLAGIHSDGWGGHQEGREEAPSPPAVPQVAEPPPEMFAYDIVPPEVDLAMQIEVESSQGEPVLCDIEALVDPYGQLLDAWATDCPDALRKASVSAVRQWNFHPPTMDNKAVRGSMTARFVYVSHSVNVEPLLPANEFLVRVSPTATPRWPTPPTAGGPGRKLMRASGRDYVRCTLELKLDPRGLPIEVQPKVCDEAILERVTRRLFRYGLDTEGASPGDGTTYRMDVVLR